MKNLLTFVLSIFSIFFCNGQDTSPNEIMVNVEEMPRFPGCEDQGQQKNELKDCSQTKLLEYVYKNLEWPKNEDCLKEPGTIIISFTIEKDGTLGNIKIARSLCPALGRAAADVFHKMNFDGLIWTPGKQRDLIVPVQYHFPIRYEIDRS